MNNCVLVHESGSFLNSVCFFNCRSTLTGTALLKFTFAVILAIFFDKVGTKFMIFYLAKFIHELKQKSLTKKLAVPEKNRI